MTAFVVTAASRLPKPVVGVLALLVLAAAVAGALALNSSPAVAGPRHVCHGYVEIKPRNQMSDLHGGAITQWLPKCRVLP